ncbi:Sodium/hydrogen exchanger family-domain-containing protein [Cadophora sp. MPI-SDFR-AT-0126]|nr:Sodium/hydrogen exchanger family-domain-containing protein [Leotiomycetes sp. MPI-SDFR-AT-0126]
MSRVASQAGVLEGLNPTTYDPKYPIIMFIIQAGIIVIFCRLLHYPLGKIRQPRVIAEVIGGVLLGPSVMMRIPGFKQAIFPPESMVGLNLVSTLGLIFFLFLVGLEVNMRMFISNWRVALSVGLAGMIIPFGLGCAISVGLYSQFKNDPGVVEINFGVYMLFIGTALSITAFPVLCRILTEMKLLGTAVGITVLAAGVGNDVVGWILLALCVALVNNGSGITALYVLLTTAGWILFLVYAVRPVFLIYLRRSGSIQNGPSQGVMAVTILLVLTSAWFTQIIGVHAIFGAFLVGLICPHDGGFAIKLTEKVEDLISVIFLPLYFALSGLGTDLGALNDGITWAYTVGVIAIAFVGKIFGGTIAARANKLVWRESFTIGVLMSCKGLVELIVLNIGLQAKILSTRTFTMFVVMALVTTIATTPLVLALYPTWYQKKLEAWKKGEIDWEGNRLISDGGDGPQESAEKLRNNQIRKLLVYLRLDSLPSLFTFIALLGGDRATVSTKIHKAKTELAPVPEGESSDSTTVEMSDRPLEVHGVRILELTERTSSVMQSSELDDYVRRDPVVNAFRTFAQLNNVAASGDVAIVPEDSYAETLTSQAYDHSSDLVLIPWNDSDNSAEFGAVHDSLSASTQDDFVKKTLETAICNTAVFLNRGFGGPWTAPEPRLTRSVSGLSLRSHRDTTTSPIADRSHHVYFPFFGGADDRVALRFVLQLAHNSNVTVTVMHFNAPVQSRNENRAEVTSENAQAAAHSNSSRLTINERVDTDTMQATADQDVALLHTLRDSLSASLVNRVVFVDVATSNPISDCLDHARQEIGQSPKNAGDLVVVGRGKHSHIVENFHVVNHEMRKTLGPIAEAIISGGVRGSVLVIKAGKSDEES